MDHPHRLLDWANRLAVGWGRRWHHGGAVESNQDFARSGKISSDLVGYHHFSSIVVGQSVGGWFWDGKSAN